MTRVSHHLANLLLVLPHAAISLFLILHHEPWRDETHAFLLAHGPDTVGGLLAAIREGEVSPPLWHLMLRGVSLFTTNFLAVSLLHWAIAVAAMCVLVWCSPFRWWEKLLVSLTYLLVFEYTVIARHYGLSVLLLFAVVAVHVRGRDRGSLECLWLALLAQTNLLGMLLAAAWWLPVTLRTRRASRVGHLLVALSFVVAIYFFTGEGKDIMDQGELVKPSDSWEETGYIVGTYVLRTFFQISSTVYWHPQWLVQRQDILMVLSVIMGLALLVLAPKRGWAGAFFGMSLILLSALYLEIGRTANIRHHGFLFIALVAALWVERSTAASAGGRGMSRARWTIWITMLMGGIWSAYWMGRADASGIYSRARVTAHKIMELTSQRQGERILWATFGSGECEGILAFLPPEQAEFFSLELDRPYRYLVHNQYWKKVEPNSHPESLNDIAGRLVVRMIEGGYDGSYLILPKQQVNMRVAPWLFLVPMLEPEPPPIIAEDEVFHFHELRAVQPLR